jgi:uncharacterized protein
MKVSGSAILHASRDQVWQALNDPAVLVRTIPGCQRLETTGPDAYAMTLTAGVASIKGVYQGEVRLTQQDQPDSFVLKAAGSGSPGTVSADVLVTLTEKEPSVTDVGYDADAIVGGMIGGVGQRMLAGVAKKTAGEFFAAVDDVLTGKTPTEPAAAAAQAGARQEGADRAPRPTVFEAPQAPAPADGFRSGVLVGAAAALVGALVGGWLAGRRR